MRAALIPLWLSAACATSAREPASVSEAVSPPPELAAELVSTQSNANVEVGPVSRGELPWWHELTPGIYQFDDRVVVLAVGDSKDHHHIAEGFLSAKVKARLLVRKISERVGFAGPMPEPQLYDLFITREQRFFALYRLDVPRDASIGSTPDALESPPELRASGMFRRGRHVFESDRHLFLECDVEGPIANPDWGRSRASARY